MITFMRVVCTLSIFILGFIYRNVGTIIAVLWCILGSNWLIAAFVAWNVFMAWDDVVGFWRGTRGVGMLRNKHDVEYGDLEVDNEDVKP